MKRLLALASVLLLAGCGRTVSEADCKKIGDNMEEVWNAEAKKLAPADGATLDKAASVIKAEGDRVQNDWAGQCKKELLGRRVDPKEVDCLVNAKSIDAISRCAEL